MPTHTPAEQAFIDASVPVHKAADELRQAVEKHGELSDAAFQVGLEQLDGRMEDAEYVCALLVAAALQAGFTEDSFIVQGLHNTLQEYRGFEAALAELPENKSAIELPAGVDLGPDEGLVM